MKCVSRSYWWLSRILLTLASLMSAPNAHGISADVYGHPSRWRDDAGKTVTLSELRGKKTVFALFYSSCKAICPMTVKSLKEIEQKVGSDVQFVLITIDPADQDANGLARLQEFRRQQKVPPAWKVLSADESNTRGLAASLGLGFADKPVNGNFHNMHSLAVAAVKADGSVAGQQPLSSLSIDQLKIWFK